VCVCVLVNSLLQMKRGLRSSQLRAVLQTQVVQKQQHESNPHTSCERCMQPDPERDPMCHTQNTSCFLFLHTLWQYQEAQPPLCAADQLRALYAARPRTGAAASHTAKRPVLALNVKVPRGTTTTHTPTYQLQALHSTAVSSMLRWCAPCSDGAQTGINHASPPTSCERCIPQQPALPAPCMASDQHVLSTQTFTVPACMLILAEP